MAKFCSNCGNKLDEKAYVCPKCGVKVCNDNKNEKGKSKVCAGLLGIFLGCFGVHNFYLGYTGKGVAQLLITVLSLFILSGISALWGLIEGILILCGNIDKDAEGNKLVE